MANHNLSRLEKAKIWFEIFGIIVVAIGGGLSVFMHFDTLKKDKSDKLYSDLIIKGTIKYVEDLGKILDYQIGPETKESFRRLNKLYNALAEIGCMEDLKKPEHKDRKVNVEPLSDDEWRELEKRYANLDDIMSMKMFFLGDGICKAIRASARMISEERPHYQSNIISREKIEALKGRDEISLFDAYRYCVFVQQNYDFLKEALSSITDYVLAQNYSRYKDYKGIQKFYDVKADEKSDDILIAFHNLKELRERYYRYEDSEKPDHKITDKGKNLCVIQLIKFFEEYNMKKRAGKKPYVAPIPDSKICTMFVKQESDKN